MNIQYYSEHNLFSKQELIDLWTSVGWTTGSLDHPERLVEALKHGKVFCAYDHQKLIGLIEGFDDSYTVYINYVLVHPSYQKMGIGTHLMEMCEKYYEGYRKVLTTDEAKAFYERFGYKHTSYGMHK